MNLYLPPLTSLKFVRDISPDDWMAKGQEPLWYYVRGYEALDHIHRTMIKAKTTPRNVLDFGMGHGCVARMLRAHYPRAMIWGQDVNQDWLDWATEHLQVSTILSAPRIADVQVEAGAYDVIWVGSVFTHTTEEGFVHLLRTLTAGLTQDGAMIFTVAGQGVRQTVNMDGERLLSKEDTRAFAQSFDSTGFGFAPYVNGTYEDWGRTLASFEYVCTRLRENGLTLIRYEHRGWGNQDVYSVKMG